jgi:membrane protease subunit HflK
MAWDDQGNGKSPWDPNKGQVPDLDQIVEEWQKRFNRLFGVKTSGSGKRRKKPPVLLIGLMILFIWVLSGLYQIDDSERGVELRFGAYSQTTMPGLKWHMPWPIETVEVVNVNVVNRFKQQTTMLTSDENIVVVDLVVQYRRANAVDYLFNVRDAEATLGEVSEGAIREVAGKSNLDFILTEGRTETALLTQELIQETLDSYGTGIVVTKVNLQDANFPLQVEAAVQDAIKAREDEVRIAFEAEAYANDVVPKARGEASKMILEAEAYREMVIADAEGEAARFDKLLVEYKKAPKVTRERLYIEAIETVYGNSNKVLLDSEASGNLMYLPLDKLIEHGKKEENETDSRGQPLPQSSQNRTNRSTELERLRQRFRE